MQRETLESQEYSAEFWKSQTEFPGLGRKLRIAVALPNKGGCAYYRAMSPYEKLAQLYPNVVEVRFTENILGIDEELVKKGIPKWIEGWDWADMDWADIVMTNNISNFGGQYTARICGKAKEKGKIFHFDTDDLLTRLYKGHRLEQVYEQGLSDTTKFIYNNSDIVTVTQRKFQERVKEFMGRGVLAVIKNAIDYDLPSWNAQKTFVPKDKFVRVGWAGGIHHEEDVKEFAGVPHIVNQKVGKEKVRWDFYGKPPPDPTGKEDWQFDVWKNYERIIMMGLKGGRNYTINNAMPTHAYGVMYSYMDMAIAPLQMNEFNDSKSEIKVAEAGRYSIPLIASNVGCYDETIINGKTGFLIPHDAPKSEWVSVLSKVIKDKDLRMEMGKNLHEITEQHFNLNKVVHQRLTLYKKFYDWKNATKV
jgi:glycosyltransferase involved in cell wall biosynthesis